MLMKEKLKKQKRQITLKITAVLFTVWMIVSIVFSSIVLYIEKDEQITKSHNDFNYLCEVLAGPESVVYNNICKYTEIVKSQQRDIVTLDLIPERTCGADGTYNTDLQITLFTYPEGKYNSKTSVLMDTDKEIYVGFLMENYSGFSTPSAGILNYDEFVSSLTEEQLDTIIDYLNIKKDKNGYFYLLRCTKTYYNPKNGHIYPKAVEIVKAYEYTEGTDDFGVSEVIEKYELKDPENAGELKLYECVSGDIHCIIDGQFVCNNFSSGGLIENPFFDIDYSLYDPYKGIIEKTGLFTYTCTEGGAVSIATLGFEGSERAIAYENEENQFKQEIYTDADVLFPSDIEEMESEFENPVGYEQQTLKVRYVKRINLLDCAKETLMIGITVLFIFFFTIGVILIVMMWKLVKSEMLEEEKRRETTNALAHDIKTPLFIISGYAQNLKENTNPEKNEHYIDRIIQRTNEVNSLVHKMLDFSRLSTVDHTLKLENVNVSQLVQKALEDFETLPDSKTISLDLDSKFEISADEVLLSRAIVYLIDNAVKYSDDNSIIKISLNSKMLSISNKCSTITSGDVKHLTEPYYRVEKNRESNGNGLGLSIVKSITDMHNFKLDIELISDTITFSVDFHK